MRVADPRESFRHGGEREVGGVDVGHLLPGERRRDPRVGRRADGIGGCDGAILGVLVVVDEDAVPLLLPPFAGGELRRAALHLAGQGKRGRAHICERPALRDADVDVDAA